MAQVINTNILSLAAQRNLNTSQASLQTSIERLSSGLRINSAKDDAAGLAISERFTTQIRGLNQAQRNANDGISFAQTAEGALSTIGENLQRMRELAVQSVNDTNSASDRQSLNNEVSQLIAEINRVANSTEFNGGRILDGSSTNLTFQVGANQGQTITVSGVDARGSQLGAETFSGDSFVSGATSIGGVSDFTLNGESVDLSGVTDVAGIVSAINLVAADSGVEARQVAETVVDTGTYTAPSGSPSTVTINGVDITLADGATIGDAVDAINAVSTQTGVTAEADGGNIILSDSSGGTIVVTDADGQLGGVSGTDPVTYEAGIMLITEVGDSIIVGGTNVDNIGLTAGTLTTESNILTNVNVLTGTNASDALLTIDFALQQINGLRAELGAVQTRFETTITNLERTSENLAAARSRIRDADFAAEVASLTQSQILMQAGISALAQANAQPQNVLALLQ